MLRVLGSVRLSRLTDASTSPERQRERIGWWTQGNDADVIYLAEDLDVSGAVSPFDRPDLGEWLTEEKADQWDVLVAWKLDRLSRSAMDTLKLLQWCEAHGKRIIAVDDGIDSATQMGQVWLQLAGVFAQVERTFIKERALASRRKLRSEGRWHGEAVMYGYRPVKLSTGGWSLEIDPEASLVVGWMVDSVLGGSSIEAIAAELTEHGLPTPREYRKTLTGKAANSKPWRATTLMKLLTSKALLGYVTYETETFYDDEGIPVLKAKPLLIREDFDRLQSVIEARRHPKANNRTRNASQLLGLAFCGQCGAKLHHRGQTESGKLYRYYYCSAKCGQRSLKAEETEAKAGMAFLNIVGSEVVLEPFVVPGENHTAELEEAVRAFEDLSSQAGKMTSRTARERLQAQLASLDGRIAKLEQLPVKQPTVEFRPTGRTYREEWKSRDQDGRRKLMADAGMVVKAKPGDFRVDLDLRRVGESIGVPTLSDQIACNVADSKAGKPTVWGGKRYKTLGVVEDV